MHKNKNTNMITNVFSRYNDTIFLGQILFVVVVLLISWSSVKAIQTNYNLEKQISKFNQENVIQKLQTENLKLKNNYLKSDQYLELSARQSLSLGVPGEKEILVPKSVALAHTINLSINNNKQTPVTKASGNINSWYNFFLHKN